MVKKNVDLTKFSHLLEEEIIEPEILFNVLSKIGDVDDLDVKCSNGNSFVVIPRKTEFDLDYFDRLFEKKYNVYNNVYQYFLNPAKAQFIFFLLNKLHKKRVVDLQLFNEVKPIIFSFNFFNYLARFVSYIPDNIITWEHHLCLNLLDNKKLKQLLVSNLTKFLWEIGCALHGLHKNGIAHGDCSIDNIGIRDGRFVLFDFDISVETKGVFDTTLYEHDFYRLKTSLQYHFDKDWKLIKKKVPGSFNSTFFLNDLILKFPDVNFTDDLDLRDLDLF